MNPIYDLGIRIIQALQTLSPALDTPMEIFTFLGTIEFYLLLIPLIYWVIDTQLGFRIFLLLISTDILGAAFKHLLRQPRPYWIGEVKHIGVETSYGIPSTHASDSFAIWGFLAYQLRRGWLWVVSCLVILLVGISRMYLGLHFPTDVLGGWLLGLIVIILFMVGERLLMPWLKKQSQTSLIATGFALSIILILIGQLVLALVASSPDPASWAEFSKEARTPSSYITQSGALFGAIAGYVLMLGRGSFQVKNAWLPRAGCYLIGMISVLIFYIGLDVLFSMIAEDASLPGYFLRYIRYAAVSFWVTFGAPWTFLKLRLAVPAVKPIEPILVPQ